MNSCKYLFLSLALAISQSASVYAAEEMNVVPSDVQITTCLNLVTMNDEWHNLSTDLSEKFDIEGIASPFEKKLRGAMTNNCSFLFKEWDKPSLEIIETRIKEICADDANSQNPYLGSSVSCKQTLAN